MAYEIVYARKVDLWDKLIEVKLTQVFQCVYGKHSNWSIDFFFNSKIKFPLFFCSEFILFFIR
jgi:hypothetical protein